MVQVLEVNISPPVLGSLGHMEDGTALGDVELPPWAKGDPQEFIRIHREVSEPRPRRSIFSFLFCLVFFFLIGRPHTLTSPIRLNNVFHKQLMYVDRGGAVCPNKGPTEFGQLLGTALFVQSQPRRRLLFTTLAAGRVSTPQSPFVSLLNLLHHF